MKTLGKKTLDMLDISNVNNMIDIHDTFGIHDIYDAFHKDDKFNELNTMDICNKYDTFNAMNTIDNFIINTDIMDDTFNKNVGVTHDTDTKCLYIDVQNLDTYYNVYRDEIESGYDYYMNYVKSSKSIHDDYLKLHDAIVALKKNDNHELKGGDGTTAFIIGGLGSLAFTGLIAYLLYLYFTSGPTCKKTYPMYDRNKIPKTGEILENVLPGRWIEQGLKQGKSLENVIKDTKSYLATLQSIFSVFDENKGNIATKGLKSAIKVGLSLGAAVLTEGAGGDNIVSIPFLISKAVTMTTKIFVKIESIIEKINNLIKLLTDKLQKIENVVTSTIQITESINKNRERIINSIKNKNNMILLLYDLFNIDFRGGPYHCRCWVEYVMNYYISDEQSLVEIMELMCMMNDIYVDINEEVLGFIGTTIDVIVPDTMGLAGTITPLLKKYSYVLYRSTREKLSNDYYNRVPSSLQMIIQNPNKLRKYLFYTLHKYTLGVSDIIIPSKAKDYMGAGLDIFTYSIHKGMATMFMFMNVFIVFSEINAGANTAIARRGLNAEKLLNECPKFIEDRQAFMKIYQTSKSISGQTFKKINKGVGFREQLTPKNNKKKVENTDANDTVNNIDDDNDDVNDIKIADTK